MADDRQYHLKFDASKGQAVDDYLEYKRIVGEDDGGKLFTPEEFEEYKKKVLPMRMKNRLYTSHTGPTGMDCKLVGPETPCFCKHRYKQHKTDFEEIPKERPIKLPCRASKCKCVSYHYVPLNGSQPIRCHCKHTADEHAEFGKFVCKKAGCTKCTGFKSSFTCGCGAPVSQHKMIVETAEERETRGHPLGEATPYAAMGGITGFSSMAEGYMRLDPSGKGAPSKGFLEQSVTSSDNPFLRSNVHAIKQHQMSKKQADIEAGLTGPEDEIFDDIGERVSSRRRPGEDEMAYFERRYQERQMNKPSGHELDSQMDKLAIGSRKAVEEKPRSGRRK
ncbi:protein FAM221A-like isoform X1 [Mercenaria mercenaria]|uniref:protein FAM221A-like isoform X1 n=1 Tax=Mercenaria mercenaria TaxID=6596 RepID=UPI001E1D6350|nr:protein FAM221A-like isoform X1 [Mercenaria mercenaria]XP_045175381.1 protein FAM221A-like isoform X1 [Mercenaria mercenaria]XP_045175382.1 protein FAM221A-like isoform X1 [Mercenaria mercenaria]XP_045175383.1 protein FAM221A-like isoform X1 [Mercenaria mercenaria]XP_053383658.1 protein FAM221A-like isoform X1 [Mercenaria mercenaria]